MKTFHFPVDQFNKIKRQITLWCNQSAYCSIYDSNQYSEDQFTKYEFIACAGQRDVLVLQESKRKGELFDKLEEFTQKHKGSLLSGYLAYDLKNDLEDLSSENKDITNFPELYFYQPEVTIKIRKGKNEIEIDAKNANAIFEQITATHDKVENLHNYPVVKARISKDEYLEKINKIQKHIQAGDIYEMNFCQEFYCEEYQANPIRIWLDLVKVSPTPFAAYIKMDNRVVICASPERYIQRTGDTIISQPIKGTIKRGKSIDEDNSLKTQLRDSQKDQTENVMIVDLVRNDLSKIAQKASVKVSELYGIYGFRQVFQMISTIEAKIDSENSSIDVLKASYPMGSMTGAPKISAMHLIEKYESSKRGLYSGSIGYFDNNGDFDFNVVIRSMLYDIKNKVLRYMVGGAITINSEAEAEYEECLLKAKAIMQILNQKTKSND